MRDHLKLRAMAFAAAAVFMVASPAHAVITTFAKFDAIGGSNLRWVNSSSDNSGSGGSLFSIASDSSTVVGSRAVSFSFLNVAIAPEVTNVTALFTLNASVQNGTPASTVGPFLLQDGLSGSFSFVTTSAISFSNVFFAAGSNLLSGTFGGGSIFGSGATGAFGASTPGGDSLTFTSDFLDFSAVTDSDMALSLADIGPVLARLNSAAALSSFAATGGGTFSSDGAPALAYPPTGSVPEPTSWALMILGFGALGARLRWRRSGVAAA